MIEQLVASGYNVPATRARLRDGTGQLWSEGCRMSTLRSLPIEDIRRRPDARPLDDVALAGLAESIDSIGLINPIRVRQVHGGYEVVAGAHRFAACDLLGHREIACFVVDDDDLHAELAMIDENLCRAELSPADRAKQTARRKVDLSRNFIPTRVTAANMAAAMRGVANFATLGYRAIHGRYGQVSRAGPSALSSEMPNAARKSCRKRWTQFRARRLTVASTWTG